MTVPNQSVNHFIADRYAHHLHMYIDYSMELPRFEVNVFSQND